MEESNTVHPAFTLNVDQLKKALNKCKPFVSHNSTLPILTTIKIKATTLGVNLIATDLEKTLCYPIDGQVEQTVSAAIPYGFLTKIVGKLKSECVKFEAIDFKTIKLTAGTSSAELKTMMVEDFPAFPVLTATPFCTVDPEVLAKALKAASRDEHRPVLTGILLERHGSSVTVAATDAYRLFVGERDNQAKTDKNSSVILPGATVEALLKITKAPVTILVDKDDDKAWVSITTDDGATVVTRQVEGQFPDYKQLMPNNKEITWNAGVSSKVMTEALDLVSVAAQKNGAIRFVADDSHIRLTAETKGQGSMTETVAVKTTGASDEMAFNSACLKDGLTVCPDPVLNLTGALKPMVMTSDQDKYLIMPIRIEN